MEVSPQLWIGIGFKEGTQANHLAYAVEQVCQQYHLDRQMIVGLATLENKAQESALVAYSRAQGWTVRSFSSQALSLVAVPHPSPRVNRHLDCASVAEAAALSASQGQLIVPKQIIPPGVTIAIALSPLSRSAKQCSVII